MARLATTAPFNFEFDAVRFLRAYRRAGCTRAQFYRNERVPIEPALAVETVREAGMTIDSMHGLFGESLDPSSPDEATRGRALDVYHREGELALALGGPMVVVHPAWMKPEGAAPGGPADPNRADALRRSMERLARLGERLGVVYLIENLPGFFTIGYDALLLATWIRSLDSPHLRMCFDSGHAHIEAQRVGPVAHQFARCADVVAYFHAHDNDTTTDNHRMPGEGTIDWANLGRAVAERSAADLPWMLEVFYPEAQVEQLVREGLGERLRQCAGAG